MTKIKINKVNQVEIEIDVDFPFYAKHDLSDEDDYTYHLKITEDKVICITKRNQYYTETFEIEVDHIQERGGVREYSGYFIQEKHKSSKEEFDAAFDELTTFINKMK